MAPRVSERTLPQALAQLKALAHAGVGAVQRQGCDCTCASCDAEREANEDEECHCKNCLESDALEDGGE